MPTLPSAARCCCSNCQSYAHAVSEDTDTTEIAALESSSVELSVSSGNSIVDGVLAGPRYFWGAEATYGMPQTITFSFMEDVPDYYLGANAFESFNETMKAAARAALGEYASVTNLTFVEVDDAGDGGQIRFGMESLGAGKVAYAYYPQKLVYGVNDPEFAPYAGDVWMSTGYAENFAPEAGNLGYYGLLHEIGHTLGLKHPHAFPYLSANLDNEDNTVMSYNAGLDGDFASTLGWIDRLALQYLYGPREAATIGNLTADGDGATRLDGDAGQNYLIGNGGDDTLSGGGGDDGLVGGDGADLIFGDDGDDFVLANRDRDRVDGGEGNDTVYGGQADDVISGGAGMDWLIGNAGDDTISGGADADALYGGQGDDRIDGGAGEDELYGNRGDDTLTGGAGDDFFVFGDGSGVDTLLDMVRNEDMIVVQRDVNGTGIASYGDVLARLADDGAGNVVLDLGAGNAVTIVGRTSADLTGWDIALFT